MLNTSINHISYSLFLNRALSEFISNNIAHIIDCELELLEESDSFIKDSSELFPKRFAINNSKETCYRVLEGIRDRLRSDTYYTSLTPLQNYVMYHAIKGYCEIADDLGYTEEWLYHKISDELKEWIYEEESNNEDAMSLIDACEHIDSYNDLIYEDLDFLDENIRAIVEYAISNTKTFEAIEMSLEDLDKFIEVMPIDVAEEYQEFRKRRQDVPDVDFEEVIVESVQNAMRAFARRIVHHKDKGEVVLTADLQEKIEDLLSQRYGVLISREFTLGRAAKVIGETDLYFYAKQDGLTQDIAVLENKIIEKFKEQYLQLMGYLNPNFEFGMTVSINRHLTIDEAKKKIVDSLKSIQGDFAVSEVYAPNTGEHYLMSEHIVPETKQKMRVYHFILNLNDQCRVHAAREGRGMK